jgi:hypothetical protein
MSRPAVPPLPPVDLALAALIEHEAFSFNFVVSCARSKDCPIVYASDGFYELTGCAAASAAVGALFCALGADAATARQVHAGGDHRAELPLPAGARHGAQ